MIDDQQNPSGPDIEATQAQEAEVSPSAPASNKRENKHLKVENPKNVQFGGRATGKEAERIKEAMSLHKKEGETYDIVRFTLDMMNHIENDFFQSFKTKKKQ